MYLYICIVKLVLRNIVYSIVKYALGKQYIVLFLYATRKQKKIVICNSSVQTVVNTVYKAELNKTV